MPLARIEDAIDAIRRGDMVILVDDEDRENEGDLVFAAEKCTAEGINFMAKHGRGLICLTMTEERLKQLELPMMVADNTTPFGTAFTVSIEAREGVTTGISAADRAQTIKVAVADNAKPHDLISPGHVFPLRARPGGVLSRTGQTEGSVDLARLAGLKPAAVICEILNDDGTMARLQDLEVFAAEHNLLIVSIAHLIQYRFERQKLLDCVVDAPFPCEYGDDFRVRVYRSNIDGHEHIVLICGDPATSTQPVPVRVTHECIIGDVFRGRDCECGWQLHGALEHMAERGVGVLVYLDDPQLSRGDAVRRYVLGESPERELSEAEKTKAVNTVPSVFRDLGVGCQILADCGVTKLTVLSNSDRKLVGLDAYGLELVGVEPIPEPSYRKKG